MLNLTTEEISLLTFGLNRLLSKAPGDSGNLELTSEFFSFSASKDAIKQTVATLGAEKIKVNRRMLRVLESYLEFTAANLSVKVIPGIDEKMRKADAAERARLEGYRAKAKAKAAAIATLTIKVKMELQSVR